MVARVGEFCLLYIACCERAVRLYKSLAFLMAIGRESRSFFLSQIVEFLAQQNEN